MLKVSADHLESYESLTDLSREAGVPQKRLRDWTRVRQLKKVDEETALILSDAGGSVDLCMLPLP